MIGGFRSDLSRTRKTDGNFGKVSAGVLFSKSFVRLGSSYSPCKFLHLFRFVFFLPSSCSVVVSYFQQMILIRLARVLCWQLVNTANTPLHSLRNNLLVSTGELTHPALSTNCKTDPPLWLVKRKWHLWVLSQHESEILNDLDQRLSFLSGSALRSALRVANFQIKKDV